MERFAGFRLKLDARGNAGEHALFGCWRNEWGRALCKARKAGWPSEDEGVESAVQEIPHGVRSVEVGAAWGRGEGKGACARHGFGLS